MDFILGLVIGVVVGAVAKDELAALYRKIRDAVKK